MARPAPWLPAEAGGGVVEWCVWGSVDVVAGRVVEVVVVSFVEVVLHAEAPTPTAIRPRTTDSLCTTRG
jgi:hypothetical protein